MARPREFDPDDALDKAMHLFWAKGYFDTSIRDLVERTGVNYYGLYGVFENKHGLFLAALDRYNDTITRDILGALDEPGSALAAIRRAFDRLTGYMETEDGQVGCMMCNTAVEVAPSDPEAAARVRRHLERIETAFAKVLGRARDEGELAPDHDLKALAEHLATAAYGVGLLTRAGFGRARVKRHIETALSLLG